MDIRTTATPSAHLRGPKHPPRVGVVLAAGRSERLNRVTRGRSKTLLEIGGVSLVERAIRMLLDAGVDRVVVVVGYGSEEVAAAALDVSADRVDVIRAADWEEGNGASLAASEPVMAGERLFAVLCADHVFADRAVDGFLRSAEPAVLVDVAPEKEAWAEGTRVAMREGRVRAFGKDLDEPGIDCGIFLLGQEVFAAHRRAAAEGDRSLAGAVSRLAEARPLRAERMPEWAWWRDIDTPRDLRAARALVRRSLIKQSDGPVSRYLNRPVSTRISMALASLRPSPDALSLVAFVVGVTAGVFLAARHGVVGGILAQATSVLDGVDGETARLQGRSSDRGAQLDGSLDRLVDALIVSGLGLWAIDATFNARTFLLMSAIAVAWVLVASRARRATISLELPPAAEGVIGSLLAGRDGRLLILGIGAVLGHPLSAIVVGAAFYFVSATVRLYIVRNIRGASALQTR
jgi:choline kinase/phosphatidylglycerophosphate synthase